MPLHPLVVHGAVVLGPLAALLALAYVVPRARQWARWPMVVTSVVASGFVLAAYLSGGDLLDANPSLRQLPAVATHEDRAAYALTATLVLAVVAVLAALLHRRPGIVPVVVRVLLALAAVGTLVAVVATGDAGSRAVWGA